MTANKFFIWHALTVLILRLLAGFFPYQKSAPAFILYGAHVLLIFGFCFVVIPVYTLFAIIGHYQHHLLASDRTTVDRVFAGYALTALLAAGIGALHPPFEPVLIWLSRVALMLIGFALIFLFFILPPLGLLVGLCNRDRQMARRM